MTISYPIDILPTFPGWTTEFEPVWRQEQSRQANGATRVKDLGSPLWRMTAQSRTLRPNGLDAWRAKLSALEGGAQQFKGYPLARTYPIAYPNGTWPTGGSFNGLTAQVSSIGTKSLALKSLPAAFALQVGDFISLGPGNLHQLMEAATANGSGVTGTFEVRPHIWTGQAVNDLAYVKRPYCLMTLVPGSLQSSADPQTGRGQITFQAIESR